MRTLLLLTSVLLVSSCASTNLAELKATKPLPEAVTKPPELSTEGSFTSALESLLAERQIELATFLQLQQKAIEDDLLSLTRKLSD